MSEKQKEAQTILAKIRKVVFGDETLEQKFTEAALEDGRPINIAGESIAEGAAVTLADGTPLADGEYKLADGSGITVAGGTITALTAAEAAAEEMAGDPVKGIDELKQSMADLLSQFKSHKEATEKEIATLKADKAKQAQAFATQKEANKQVIDLLEILVKEPQAAPAAPSRNPFAAQKPDRESKIKEIADTLQKIKEAKNK